MNKILWEPSQERIQQSNLYKFMKHIEKKYNTSFQDVHQLWQWSIQNNEDFWCEVWDFTGIVSQTRGERVTNNASKFHENRYFPDARLNFAENLLQKRSDEPAIIFWGETIVRSQLSWNELYDAVAKTADALRRAGVQIGDIVGGYVANTPETMIAALATISIGAIWSSCSPDFGVAGALDRFGQVQPKILFAVDGYYYKGKTFNNIDKIDEVTATLSSIEKVIIIPYIKADFQQAMPNAVSFYDFNANATVPELVFEQLPFNHPVFIMFTSGTTGAPKCIVHGAGGTLLQQKKEHQLHCDIKENDRVLYFTTCSWMMWNWLFAILSSKATLLLYEGLPLYPTPTVLFDMADECGMTMFGTSAKYLDMLTKSEASPITTHKLSSLRTITSTGSPLSEESFKYVYSHIKKDIHLNVFSGGTDIISCFITGNTLTPVIAGQMQGVGLGMAVDVFDANGKSLPVGQQGDLVCTKTFPSQPIGFWNDPNDTKFLSAYFETYEGVWSHGDWIEFTPEHGVIISGRADAVLNPSGVRIGTAEIYAQVQKVYEVLECVAVGQKFDNDERVILFVTLREGLTLNDEIKKKINTEIRTNATARHVPAKIIQVPSIAKTKNGKISEVAIKCVIHGKEVKNKESLEDANVLDYFKDLEELKY